MLQVSSRVSVPLEEIELKAIRSQGPRRAKCKQSSDRGSFVFRYSGVELTRSLQAEIAQEKRPPHQSGWCRDHQIPVSPHPGSKPGKSPHSAKGTDPGNHGGAKVPPAHLTNP